MRVPFVIDLHRVRDPAVLVSVANDTRLSRPQTGRGPLLNRLIARIAGALLSAHGHRLPSGRDPDDPTRRELRDALLKRLADPGLDDRLAEPVAAAAAYIKGGPGDPMALAQALLAPVVADDLPVNARMVEAAKTIGAALNGGTLRQFADWLFGRSAAARDRLYTACRKDLNAVHALGVASQNLAASLDILRTNSLETPARLALGRAITAPNQVVRQGRGPAETLAGPVRNGSLVLLETGNATERTLDRRIAFLTEAWSGCPAHDFVPKLLHRIWAEAGGAP